jgi:hypothetical protein
LAYRTRKLKQILQGYDENDHSGFNPGPSFMTNLVWWWCTFRIGIRESTAVMFQEAGTWKALLRALCSFLSPHTHGVTRDHSCLLLQPSGQLLLFGWQRQLDQQRDLLSLSSGHYCWGLLPGSSPTDTPSCSSYLSQLSGEAYGGGGGGDEDRNSSINILLKTGSPGLFDRWENWGSKSTVTCVRCACLVAELSRMGRGWRAVPERLLVWPQHRRGNHSH